MKIKLKDNGFTRMKLIIESHSINEDMIIEDWYEEIINHLKQLKLKEVRE